MSPSARITGVGICIPPRRVSNDELATIVDTSDEWIYSHTGIHYRHIAGADVAASDLAVDACEVALEQADVAAAAVDMVLLATSTPDYPGLPATASIVQHRIGAERAGAMDLVAACTGFIYGLATGAAFVRSGAAATVLVVGSEVFSKILNWKDRNTCVLFGDGAGAAVLQAREGSEETGILDSVLRSRGSGADSLLRAAGGSRTPCIPGTTPDEATKLKMDGRRVYNFAVGALGETIQALLDRNGLTFDEIDHVIPHQANVRIIEAACKRSGYSFDKFFMNIAEYANTSAASIPIAMHDMLRAGMLRPGQLAMTVGFGSGLSYGGNLIRF